MISRGSSNWPVLLVGMFVAFCAEAQQFHFEVFKPESGLPASGVYAIDQDENGYIWIATSEGLARYDGYTAQNFTEADGLGRGSTTCSPFRRSRLAGWRFTSSG